MKRVVLVALLLVLAGCSGFGLGSDDPAQSTTEDPQEDRLGWESGYWYNDSVDVNASDGLDEEELDVVTARAMARVEEIRGLEFQEDVPVEILTREEYREQNFVNTSRTASTWNNQVWEALLLVGENRNITQVFEEAYGGAVLGYYSAEEQRIVVVSDSDEPKISRGTLYHELVHALQDQHFGLEEAPPTQDEQLARNGVVEGEANLLEQRAVQRCGQEWSCIQNHPTGGTAGDIPSGVLTLISYPYVAGPSFVEAVEARGGWDAVDALHEDYPESTEQVSSPSLYPDEQPTGVTVPDRSNAEWERFDHDPVGDTTGQASMQILLQENVVGVSGYEGSDTDGWGDDRVVPYRNGDRYGYVWVTEWDTRADAREFHNTYLDALDSHDATSQGDGIYVVPSGDPFADAFHVQREGTTVRIVNAPTVDELGEVHDDVPA